MTTHDWAKDVDRAHLAAIQAGRDCYAAGGVRHLILEVLAYANDEAEDSGRVGQARVIMESHETVTVVDDGRGTDTRTDAEGFVIRKPVMATKHSTVVGATQAAPQPGRARRLVSGCRRGSRRVHAHRGRETDISRDGECVRPPTRMRNWKNAAG